MGRSPCCDENGLKKGPWTPEEDKKLVQYITKHGHGSWRALPKLAGLNRCGKSCRLRWTNYLRPDIKRGKFSKEEEQKILNLHSILGNKWSTIATHLPGRTDNEIKNFWNTHLKKQLIQLGFDPMTHRPRTDIFATLPHLIALGNLKEVMEQQPWEEHAVRLQEAVQLAKFQYLNYLLQSTAEMTGGNAINSPRTLAEMASMPSPKETMEFNYSLEEDASPSSVGIPISQPINDQVPYSPSLDHQFPCNFQPPVGYEIDQDANFELFSQDEYKPKSPVYPSPPPIVSEDSIGNPSDACSSSSFGESGPPFWPELLLDDPFFI